jgi:hypothetical protein
MKKPKENTVKHVKKLKVKKTKSSGKENAKTNKGQAFACIPKSIY